MPSSSPRNSAEPSGLLRTLLAAFSGVLFGIFLSKFRTPIHKSTDAPDSHNTTDQSTDDSSNYSVRRIGVTETNCPPAPAQCNYPQKKPKHWLKRWKPYAFLLNIATFLAVVWYACITNRIWHEMHTQTVNQSQQFSATQRPWIGVSKIDVYAPLAYTDGQTKVVFQLRYTLKNVGHSPAKVAIYGKIIDANELKISGHDWQTEQENICKRAIADYANVAKWQAQAPNTVIQEFPMIYDDSYDGITEWWDGHVDKPLMLDRQIVERNGGTFMPVSVGCVLYLSPIDNTFHQTGFSAHITMGLGGKAPSPGGSIPIKLSEREIPAEKLFVIDVLAVGKSD